jgi:hypothetical protein
MVSFVVIMHGIQEQASFAWSIKANVVYGVMPMLIILMQPVDVTYPSLELVAPIVDKEHLTKDEL